MKIRNFSVNNYRGISGGLDNNRIDFDGIYTLFIFGQNNTGKSTFLRAYEFFYLDADPAPLDFYRQSSDNSIQIEMEVEIDDWDMQRIEEAAPKAKESYKKYLIDNCRIRLRDEWTLDGKKAKKKRLLGVQKRISLSRKVMLQWACIESFNHACQNQFL